MNVAKDESEGEREGEEKEYRRRKETQRQDVRGGREGGG